MKTTRFRLSRLTAVAAATAAALSVVAVPTAAPTSSTAALEYGGQSAQSASTPSHKSSQAPAGPGRGERTVGDDRLEQREADKGRAGASTVMVEVLHSLTDADAAKVVTDHGGTVTGSVPGVLVEASVHRGAVAKIERARGISMVRAPTNIAGATQTAAPTTTTSSSGTRITGEEVAKTRADVYHRAGIKGANVKIGIVDLFGGTLYQNAMNAGELPQPAGVFCRNTGANCNIWATGDAHGEGVAEIVAEMAPSAQLYLATAVTASDLQAAVNWFVANGVHIVTRSLTSQYDGSGNGSGAVGSVVANATSRGISWFQSAGNSAGGGTRAGSYYRKYGFTDQDRDGYMEFSGTDELMSFNCGYINGLRWDDWGTSRTDYDAYVYDMNNRLVAKFEGDQTKLYPIEHVSVPCTNKTYQLAIKLYATGNGTSDDTIEFMVNGQGLEYWQTRSSVSGPAADHPSAMTVAAIDPPLGTTLANYSAQGPTNDPKILKPELAAASCVRSYTFSATCFNGTSAATPVAAGAAALVLSGRYVSNASQLKTWLLSNAITDRGPTGNDWGYGRGELILPVR